MPPKVAVILKTLSRLSSAWQRERSCWTPSSLQPALSESPVPLQMTRYVDGCQKKPTTTTITLSKLLPVSQVITLEVPNQDRDAAAELLRWFKEACHSLPGARSGIMLVSGLAARTLNAVVSDAGLSAGWCCQSPCQSRDVQRSMHLLTSKASALSVRCVLKVKEDGLQNA